MDFLTDLFDYSLIHHPNIFFTVAFLLAIIIGLVFVKIILGAIEIFFEVHRTQKHIEHLHISYTSLLAGLIYIIMFSVKFILTVLRYINKNLQQVEHMGQKIAKIIKKEIFISSILVVFLIASSPVYAAEYELAWPGILPDNPLYKVKILRNKIIERLIIHPSRKVEFYLLMADKTLYASKLLLEKGEYSLARETALKGENYFSMLTAEYEKIATKNRTIPTHLRDKINSAYRAHQQLISYLYNKAPEQDKKTFENIVFFSYENHRILQKHEQFTPKKDK